MSSPEQLVKLFQIAGQMSYEGLSRKLAVKIIAKALEYEGLADLIGLWSEETDAIEKKAIIVYSRYALTASFCRIEIDVSRQGVSFFIDSILKILYPSIGLGNSAGYIFHENIDLA